MTRDRFQEEADAMRFLAEDNMRLTTLVIEAEAEKKQLRAALAEMILTQDKWEAAITKALGRPPKVFTRALVRARAVLVAGFKTGDNREKGDGSETPLPPRAPGTPQKGR